MKIIKQSTITSVLYKIKNSKKLIAVFGILFLVLYNAGSVLGWKIDFSKVKQIAGANAGADLSVEQLLSVRRNLSINTPPDFVEPGGELKTYNYYNYVTRAKNNGSESINLQDISLQISNTQGVDIPRFTGDWSFFEPLFATNGGFSLNNFFRSTSNPNQIKYGTLCIIRLNGYPPVYGYDEGYRTLWTPDGSGGYKLLRCGFDVSGQVVLDGVPYVGSTASTSLLTSPVVPAVVEPGGYFEASNYFYVPRSFAGEISLTSTVSVANDVDMSNNSVTKSYMVYEANLKTDIKRINSTTLAGEIQTYRVTVTNDGPTIAKGPVTITSKLNPKLNFQQFIINDNNWNCTHSNQNIDCTYIPGDLALNASSTFDFTAIINP